MIRRILPLVAGLLWASSAFAADYTLLNVSYDPTRELYADFNKAFVAAYAKETGKSVEIKQSHAQERCHKIGHRGDLCSKHQIQGVLDAHPCLNLTQVRLPASVPHKAINSA